ncbi:unnamed protein product [Prorocentrum cordatum]|uniref:Uncharacterized protein n=1 Tax=Prorocentrum cordatum TaxID=2364126 RepID=A0ABN9VHR0_9DINO|nr:unnamed protein product [Polarella glacialis]
MCVALCCRPQEYPCRNCLVAFGLGMSDNFSWSSLFLFWCSPLRRGRRPSVSRRGGGGPWFSVPKAFYAFFSRRGHFLSIFDAKLTALEPRVLTECTTAWVTDSTSQACSCHFVNDFLLRFARVPCVKSGPRAPAPGAWPKPSRLPCPPQEDGKAQPRGVSARSPGQAFAAPPAVLLVVLLPLLLLLLLRSVASFLLASSPGHRRRAD